MNFFAFIYANSLKGKWADATGNHHSAVDLGIDGIKLQEEYTKRLGVGHMMAPAQITGREFITDTVYVLARTAETLQNLAFYIAWGMSDDVDIFKDLDPRKRKGSSAMPHKVNPIDFENSEGNLGMANALFTYFSSKLPISRLQRDLSDSTVERNFGIALAHSLIAYQAIQKGLSKISPNRTKILEDLDHHYEVIAEGIQTILRRENVAMPYEALKNLTRGKKVTRKDFQKFIDKLKVSEKIKKELRKISPRTYIGLAEKLSLF